MTDDEIMTDDDLTLKEIEQFLYVCFIVMKNPNAECKIATWIIKDIYVIIKE